MAKRKRLTPANPAFLAEPTPATEDRGAKRAPIADVASDASAMAALELVTEKRRDDVAKGRLIQTIAMDQIDLNYLVRDRVVSDDAEMQALVDSIRERGQQTPVEVVELEDKRYGLISGWRRCAALRQIAEETGKVAFVDVVQRQPETASDAYLAMVEENEIRVGLSYFERARIALKAVEQGVFETEKQALLSLFRAASRAKRSKIRSFLSVVKALDGVAAHPHLIGERLGLQLAKRLEEEPAFQAVLKSAIEDGAGRADQEQELLKKALNEGLGPKATVSRPQASKEEIRPGLLVRTYEDGGRLELFGKAMTPALRAEILAWLKKNA